jgi:hypothetical protein
MAWRRRRGVEEEEAEARGSGAVLSKVRIKGLGSKAVLAAPDRRLAGTALSARLSTKSRTMKSLLEKLSNVKLGPLGKRLLGSRLARSIVGETDVGGGWSCFHVTGAMFWVKTGAKP